MQNSLINTALQQLIDGLQQEVDRYDEKPSDWIQKNFWVPDPRDPVTGREYNRPGPIILAQHQCDIVNEALSRDDQGFLKYSTIVYSAPKKSGKSAITSAVITYMAHHNPYSYLYCLANDEKQSNSRLYVPISRCYDLNRKYGGPLNNESPTLRGVTLSNGTRIEPLPVDAAGEAGSQPLMTAWCFDEETEILTKDGWKRYVDLDENTVYATVNPDSGSFEWQKARDLFLEKYSGKMCLYETSHMSACVTPNHKFLGHYRRGDIVEDDHSFAIGEKLQLHIRGSIQFNQNTWGEFSGKIPDFIENTTFSFAARSKRKSHRTPLVVSLKDFVELLAWFLSEGCIKYKTRNGKTKPECVMIAASESTNPTAFNHIWQLLIRMGLKPTSWKNNDSICFYDARVTNYFTQFGHAQDKYVPMWVKDLPSKYLQIFLHAYYDGDGHAISMKHSDYGFAISTISQQMAEDLSEIGLKLGYAITLSEYEEPRSQYTVKVIRFRNGSSKKYISTNVKKWKYVDYEGYVWCPSTPNGIIFVRRNRSPVYTSHNSELWGYETPNKHKMWVEMTIPPTLYGRALRWVETYAGYSGESELLEQLYRVGFLESEPHPDFLHLQGRDGPVVRTNKRAGMFVYWDTEHRMPWQTPDYYREQAQTMSPTEFDRIHNNRWVSPIDSFIREEWWDACENLDLPVLESSTTPVVVAIDMAETGDCAALIAITRDPFDPLHKAAVRAVRIFNPKRLGGIINQEEDVRPVMEEWASKWNVVCWVYDPREMSKLAQDLTRGDKSLGWFRKFGQTNPRSVADKALYDMVVSKQISWNRYTTYGDIGFAGDTSLDTLRRHITLAGANTNNESRRLIKLSNNNKIDAAVAMSMGVHICMELAIGNDENNTDKLIRQYQRHEISDEEFKRRVKQVYPQIQERIERHDYRRTGR